MQSYRSSNSITIDAAAAVVRVLPLPIPSCDRRGTAFKPGDDYAAVSRAGTPMNQPSHALAAVDVARVLVVANDETSLQRTAHALREAGFAVASVGDEQLALRSLGPEIDLIVVTDGLQLDARGLCAAIRARSRLPIVMLGTRSAEDDVVRAFDAGVDDYLASPWSDRTLVARIRCSSAPLRCPRPRGRCPWRHCARRRSAALVARRLGAAADASRNRCAARIAGATGACRDQRRPRYGGLGPVRPA